MRAAMSPIPELPLASASSLVARVRARRTRPTGTVGGSRGASEESAGWEPLLSRRSIGELGRAAVSEGG
jgi:hypothetical protein